MDKKFKLDLKDINEPTGIDYEVSMVGDVVYLCNGSLVLQCKLNAVQFYTIVMGLSVILQVYLTFINICKTGTDG